MNEAKKLALQIMADTRRYHEMNLPHPDFEAYLWACRFFEYTRKVESAKHTLDYYAKQSERIKERLKK